jgi:hypothetical protein
MIAWALSFVQIGLSIVAMGVSLFYITDLDRENGYSWDEWCLWVVLSCCAACAISASILWNLLLLSRKTPEVGKKVEVKRKRNIPNTTENE